MYFVALFCVPFALFAQPTNSPTGFSFLRAEPSARAMALGGAFSAIAGQDVSAFIANPAALNPEMNNNVALSYTNQLADLKGGFVGFVHDAGKLGTAGVAVRFLDYGTLTDGTPQGEITNYVIPTFRPTDMALTIGLGRKYSDKVRYGVNLHGIFSSISTYEAKAIAADAGVLFQNTKRQFTASASVHNVGLVLKSFGETKDTLPMDVRLGLTKKLEYMPLMLSLMAYNLHDFPKSTTKISQQIMAHLAIGGEFQLGQSVAVRIGYNHKRNQDLRYKTRLDTAGLGLGLGIKLSRFRFDYGYNNWSIAGRVHQLTVQSKL
jgi:hypothetical protein